MKRGFFRICSSFLVIVLLVNMLPMGVFAQELRESIAAAPEETVEAADTSEVHIVQEITENRTEFSKEFLLSNGLHMATVYPDAVHYETEDGWEEIDNTFVTKADGTLTNTAGVWDVSFPQQLSGDESITIEKDGYTLSFSLDGELNTSQIAAYGRDGARFDIKGTKKTNGKVQKMDWAEMRQSVEFEEMVPEKSKSRLTYSDVYENTDIIYDLDSNTVKESIVLGSYSDTLQGYTYTLEVDTMIPVLEEDGQITLYDESRENIVMVMPAPFLVDDAGEHNTDVEVQLTGSGSTYTMTYLLPQQWLAAEERAWPVVLDPIVEAELTTSNIRDTTITELYYKEYNWGQLHTGYWSEYGKAYIFLKYDNLPEITSSDVIVQASVHLHTTGEHPSGETLVEVHKVDDVWESENITWANQPGHDPDVEDFVVVDDVEWNNWIITDIVRDWYADKNTGMMFKASDEIEEAKEKNYKRFFSSDYSDYNNSKPILTITFRNNNGLESHWDYTSSSAGRAGTGHINNFTGNLVWTRNDIGFDGNRMPVTISHVYNLNDVITPSDSNNANDSGGNSFGMGLGWRTNFNQLVYQWSTDSTYYVWEDADGTDHYFEYSSANTYKDEDDEELTLTTNGSGTSKYVITGKYGDTLHFDTQGRLTKQSNNQATKSSITITYTNSTSKLISTVTDGAGRVYSFTYNSSNLLSRISYKGTGSTVLSYVDFGYTGTKLTTVTDKDGEISTYGYNTTGLLTSAQDIDGYKLTYTYNTVSESWQPYRVQSVSETDGSANGGSLTFSYAHNQTTITDHEGNVQILQFNDYGNTICIQDDEGRAQYTQFAYNTAKEAETVKANDSTAKNNQLRLSSDLQYTVSNLMVDNSMRDDYLWWPHNLNEGEYFVVGERCSIDTKSLFVYTGMSPTDETGMYYHKEFPLKPGERHTFSCYIASKGPRVYLKAVSEALLEVSEPLPVSANWQRAQLTCTNTTDTVQYVTYYVLSRDSGDFYIDCPQLERSVSTASRYNMANNGDFNHDDPDHGWSSSGLSSADGVTTISSSAAPQLDSNVYKITGDPTGTKCISQTIRTNGKAGDSMTFSGWAKGNSAPLESYDTNEREFAIKAVIHYKDDTTSEPFYARFNPDSDQWQYAAGGLVAKKDFWTVTVSLVYNYNVNTVYFDGIQVNKDEFGSCYEYDEDGNVVSIVDSNSKETTYEYTNNDLTAEILSTGSKLTYTYDDYHNVKTATTEEGLVYTFTYDTYGNNTKVSITGDGKTMSSTATYSSDGNRLVSTTDALGKVTTYSYNADTNIPEWVQYPGDTDGTNGTVDTRTKYTYDSMYRMVSATGTVDAGDNPGTSLSASYTYTDDLLTAIQTPSTTYSFTYTDFALRTSVKVGDRTLATYKYTEEAVNDRNYDLDRLEYGNDDVVEYEYDDQGRVTKQTYEDGETVSYTYGHSGKIATVTSSATGITGTYTYDGVDRLIRYIETGGDHDYLVRYTYNDDNQVRYIYENVTGARDHNAEFTYDDDNRIASYRKGNGIRTYTYDLFDRVSSAVVTHKGADILKTDYTFTAPSDTTASGQVATMRNKATDYDVTYSYTYDDNGNILSISDGTNTTSYVYDSANQLLRENNQAGNFTHTWTYDNAGNILNRKEYSYTTGELGEPTDTVTYTYDDSDWGDLLTIYDGNTITYDEIGNPLTDGTWTYTWEHGRQLDSMTDGETTWDFTYGADGLRTKRTDGTTTYDYIYYGGQLMYMYTDEHNFHFTYTPEGTPMGIVYQGYAYYYVTNLQGDVVAILNNKGEQVVTYTYDAWGNILSVSGSKADTLGTYNPLRYRGYVYDNETGLYYLQSRYYNPEMGRFINADSLLNQLSILGNNMYAYCLNNPVNMGDTTGNLPFFLVTAAIGAVAGAIIGGVAAAQNGGNVWAGMGIGAAVGGLAGAGLGAAAGVMLAGSATASTTAVLTGAGALASTVGSAGAAAGFKLIADNITQACNNIPHVFWSGGDLAKNAAEQVANNVGGTSLEMTQLGKYLESINASYQAWQAASANFANVANSTGCAVYSIQNAAGIGLQSTWATIEYPILKTLDIIYGVVMQNGCIQIIP